MKQIKLLGLSTLLLCATTLVADKPVWAGNGGKPSQYEKEDHKREMTSKHEDKKNKYDDRDEDYDRNHDREVRYDSHRDGNYGTKYEGKGQSDGEYIEQKTDETKKNWIGKFFDFLN
jgi:hypothetical protein